MELKAREGARWGNDPEPVTPQIPAEYALLCRQYGEANVQRAGAIVQQLRNDYPGLAFLQRNDFAIAGEILKASQRGQESAAADGRAHSMPAALNRASEVIGAFLAQNPDVVSLDQYLIRFADEHEGNAAKAAQAEQTALATKAKEKSDGIKGAVVLCVAFIAFCFGAGSSGWGLGLVFAAIAFYVMVKILED